jgi:Transposase, Mutator family
VSQRVSPTLKIRAQIDAVFDGSRESVEILEEVARLGAQLIIQTAVEAEVTEFLGRARYQRMAACEDANAGSRNGYCPTTVKTTAGPVTVARPKLRGTTELFASRPSLRPAPHRRVRPTLARLLPGRGALPAHRPRLAHRLPPLPPRALDPHPALQLHRAHLRRNPPPGQGHRPAARRDQLHVARVGRARPRLPRLARVHHDPGRTAAATRPTPPTPPTTHTAAPTGPTRHRATRNVDAIA